MTRMTAPERRTIYPRRGYAARPPPVIVMPLVSGLTVMLSPDRRSRRGYGMARFMDKRDEQIAWIGHDRSEGDEYQRDGERRRGQHTAQIDAPFLKVIVNANVIIDARSRRLHRLECNW